MTKVISHSQYSEDRLVQQTVANQFHPCALVDCIVFYPSALTGN